MAAYINTLTDPKGREPKRLSVGWVCSRLSASAASTRYRCFYPAAGLERRGIRNRYYQKSRLALRDLDELDALVFVKLFDASAIEVACQARNRGVRIFLDLCDNVVVSNYATTPDVRTLADIGALSAIADAVVFSSPALEDALRPHLAANARIVTIPDQIEDAQTVQGAAEHVPQSQQLRAILSRVRAGIRRPSLVWDRLRGRHPVSLFRKPQEPRSTNRKLVVWFGNHGAAHSNFGMLGLLRAVSALEAVNRDIPLELLVISDDRYAFDAALTKFEFPARFQQWTFETVFDAMKDVDVCLLPFGTDLFSLTKSANRAVLALHHGVPVVTDRLRSMEPLADAVVFDDWEGGLRRYLGPDGAIARKESIASARKILAAQFSSDAIASAWHDLIIQPLTCRRYGLLPGSPAFEIGVLLQCDTDSDKLLPLIEEFSKRSEAEIKVLVSPRALKSQRVIRFCAMRGIVPLALKPLLAANGDYRAFGTLDTLVLVTQSLGDLKDGADACSATALKLGVRVLTIENSDIGASVAEPDDHAAAAKFVLCEISKDDHPTYVATIPEIAEHITRRTSSIERSCGR